MNISSTTLLKLLKNRWDGTSEKSGSSFEVDRLTEPISYEDFFYNYLFCNKPCLVGNWATKLWKSQREWVVSGKEDTPSASVPNFKLLSYKFGHAKVSVADCNQRYFNSQCKSEMSFRDYLTYWEKYIRGNHPKEDPCLYLKDWHFFKDFENYQAYRVPLYFQSDWLNEFSDVTSKDDFRFVYMGPKGSWTPFHADVYRSFSWSVNVCGRKKWILFPPGEEKYLKNERDELPYDVTEVQAHCSRKKIENHIVIIQEPGEVIFIPTGWYHQVHNLDDTISINHNWLNGSNLSAVTNFLLSQLELVKNEISDCKTLMTEEEWLHQCQVILKADSGMDLSELVACLQVIAESRIIAVNGKTSEELDSNVVRELLSNKAIHNELCSLIKKRLRNIKLGDVLPQKHCAPKGNSGTKLCVNHAVFDLCMILDVLDQLVYESHCNLEKSASIEAETVLKNAYGCLQSFVNASSR